jgi:hydroxymethylpyrimidine kinase/phosphomethylpyrimidine kinase
MKLDQVNDSGVPVVLTIAGLDPSGSAGILADTRTISAFDCYPTAVVTAVTFQNANGVYGFVANSAEVVRGQLMPLFQELAISCVKTGMLPKRETVLEVARVVREFKLNCLVVDPVMVSTSGYTLMDEPAVKALKSELLPLASLVTPNIPEAEALVGFSIGDEDEMGRAAEEIRGMGARAVLIKGGHLKSSSETPAREVMDLLDNDGHVTVFRGEWIEGATLRGSGCRLASAISACLAQGNSLEEAVQRAREYIAAEMRRRRESTNQDPSGNGVRTTSR